MLECPQCGLINPPEAVRCDYGYDFANPVMEGPNIKAPSPWGWQGWKSLANDPLGIVGLVKCMGWFVGSIISRLSPRLPTPLSPRWPTSALPG